MVRCTTTRMTLTSRTAMVRWTMLLAVGSAVLEVED